MRFGAAEVEYLTHEAMIYHGFEHKTWEARGSGLAAYRTSNHIGTTDPHPHENGIHGSLEEIGWSRVGEGKSKYTKHEIDGVRSTTTIYSHPKSEKSMHIHHIYRKDMGRDVWGSERPAFSRHEAEILPYSNYTRPL